MHHSLPPKPSPNSQITPSQPRNVYAQASVASSSYLPPAQLQPALPNPGPAAHFTNANGYHSAGYGYTYQWNQTAQYGAYNNGMQMGNMGYGVYGMASTPFMSAPLVNPYAPQINYNVLPTNSRGEPVGMETATGSSSGGLGWNGSGTVGPVRCGHPGCLFRGNHKSVELHKMDRHLIFPPGWEDQQQRKRKRGLQDDDELSEEQIAAKRAGVTTIQGTTMVLDTPEAIQAWIAERKKRYPSAKRVEDKQRALQEAKDRGQILPNEGSNRRKSRADDASAGRGFGRERGRGSRGRGSHRGRGGHDARHDRNTNMSCADGGSSAVATTVDPPSSQPNRRQDGGWAGRRTGASSGFATAGPGQVTADVMGQDDEDSESDSDSSSSSSGSDVDPVKDAISSRPPPGMVDDSDALNALAGADLGEGLGGNGEDEDEDDAIGEDELPIDHARDQDPNVGEPSLMVNNQHYDTTTKTTLRPPRRKPAPKPRQVHKGPFSNRPSLLRNLLLPDIRTTVSNLSQAIRFLVANNFLEGVELKPGEAANPLIQVVNGAGHDIKGADSVNERPDMQE